MASSHESLSDEIVQARVESLIYDVELTDRTRRPRWMYDAACRGMDTALWFPVRGDPATTAKAICAVCPVAVECRKFALSSPEVLWGVWAGTSARERKRLRKAA